jgi:hypothetical protein
MRHTWLDRRIWLPLHRPVQSALICIPSLLLRWSKNQPPPPPPLLLLLLLLHQVLGPWRLHRWPCLLGLVPS